MPEAATMAATAHALPQYMRALEQANAIRLARADLKRRIAAGRLSAAEVILDPPEEARSMAVADLLMSQRRWGYTRCRKFLQDLQISETRQLGQMTERQRIAVAQILREGGRPSRERRETGFPAGLTPVVI